MRIQSAAPRRSAPGENCEMKTMKSFVVECRRRSGLAALDAPIGDRLGVEERADENDEVVVVELTVRARTPRLTPQVCGAAGGCEHDRGLSALSA